MPVEREIAVLIGSLRKDSLTRKATKALIALAPSHLRLRIVEFGDLPLYNQDRDGANAPAEWVRFREEMQSAAAVLFATPEYNRSVPGGLKNAIDVGSRPGDASVFKKKPAAVMSVTPGALGAAAANHHLRQSLVFLDMPVLQQPEMYIGRVGTLLDEQGGFTNEDTKKLFQKFIDAFDDWIARTA